MTQEDMIAVVGVNKTDSVDGAGFKIAGTLIEPKA
jgi:hypothetical protein